MSKVMQVNNEALRGAQEGLTKRQNATLDSILM